MHIYVVTNESGKIIAAAHVSNATDAIQTGFIPLAGQKIFELEVPHALSEMEPHDRLRAVLKHRVHTDGTRLEPLQQK